ncbi:MAG TPA: LLM class flavin-dependent oxidoreductase [Acidimicrobiales bacterium]
MGSFDGGRAVSFGIRLPIAARSNLCGEPWEAQAGVDELTSIAQVAEHAGFAYVAVRDRLAVAADPAHPLAATSWDCVSTLSYLAAVTDRIRLLSHGYVLIDRHPQVVARKWATLDTLSGGRAILGVAGGNAPAEPVAPGAAGADHAPNGARPDESLDESLDAVRVALDGTVCPARSRLPIWIEGSSPAAMRRAAERGDGWLSAGPPAGGMSAGIARLREMRGRAGKADEPFTVGAMSGPLYVGEPRWDVGRAVHGSPDQIASFLRVLAGLGADQIQVTLRSRDVHELYDQLRVFGADVAPRVAYAPVP